MGTPPGAVDVSDGSWPALSKLGCAFLCPSLAQGKSAGGMLRDSTDWGGQWLLCWWQPGHTSGHLPRPLAPTDQGTLTPVPSMDFFPSQHQNPSLFLVLMGVVL